VLTPGKKRGEVHAELRGQLMGILELADAKKIKELAILWQQWMPAPQPPRPTFRSLKPGKVGFRIWPNSLSAAASEIRRH
jgi:hypothetical protein